MRTEVKMLRILSSLALACVLAIAATAQTDNPKVSGGERDAAQKIEKAAGAQAKLDAAANFVKKYPQSALRRQIAESIAQVIAQTTDASAKGKLAQTFLGIFNQPDEASLVTLALLTAYMNTGQTQDAMRLGAEWLAKNPDDIAVLQNLTIMASGEAIKGNNTFITQGREYGAKAIALVEADRMPSWFEAAKWPEYKKQALVSLYREMGILAFKAGETAAAIPFFEKAIEHGTIDGAIYLLLTDLHNDVYERAAKAVTTTPSAEYQAAKQKAEAALDRVIESAAQAIAFTDGKPEFAQANAALRERLTPYYKYRHNSSTDGMEQLIEKYKKRPQ
ncbi:MAG TPA: hypothetical protein VJT50_14385 [Pyrinomonadaceae bacterium]|nr:hypothetical protein [Pyrinomonadaceae bacterium]